jgi:hypothetical protein
MTVASAYRFCRLETGDLDSVLEIERDVYTHP